MTKSFVLPLSNCYMEFEKEVFGYFEDFDFGSFLRTSYSFHVCGHETIDYIDCVIYDNTVDCRILHRSGWSYSAGSYPCKEIDDLIKILYCITGFDDKNDDHRKEKLEA